MDKLPREPLGEAFQRGVPGAGDNEGESPGFEGLFEALPDPSLLIDWRGYILDANPAAQGLFGWPRAKLKQMRYQELLVEEEGLGQTVSQMPGRLFTHHHRRKDGATFPADVAVGSLRIQGQAVTLYTLRDVSQRVQLEAELWEKKARFKFLAYHDTLTGLPNRLLFQDRLEHSLAVAKRRGHQLALLFIDVDHFKKVNDSWGHEAGDQVLCEVSRRLHQGLREADTLARMGGDEFLVILEKVKGPRQVARVTRRIQENLAAGVSIHGRRIELSVSIGGSIYPLHASEPRGLIGQADRALLQAKEQGRNTFRLGGEVCDAGRPSSGSGPGGNP